MRKHRSAKGWTAAVTLIAGLLTIVVYSLDLLDRLWSSRPTADGLNQGSEAAVDASPVGGSTTVRDLGSTAHGPPAGDRNEVSSEHELSSPRLAEEQESGLQPASSDRPSSNALGSGIADRRSAAARFDEAEPRREREAEGELPRLGEPFHLQVGEAAWLATIETQIEVISVRLGTQDERVLRVRVLPADSPAIGGHLVGDLGRVGFEALGGNYLATLRRTRDADRIEITVSERTSVP